MNFNQKVTDYIDKASEEQIAILETLRQLIQEKCWKCENFSQNMSKKH